MTPEAYVDRAKGWAGTLEDYEARRGGDRLVDARERVARALKTTVGTLANLRNRNPKTVEPSLYARLQLAVLRELERELARVEHEIHVTRQAGLDPASGEMHAVLASRDRLRSALGLSTGGAA